MLVKVQSFIISKTCFRSLLFFSMLLSLGIGSQIGIMEGMIGTLFDIPQLKHIKKPILTGKYQ